MKKLLLFLTVALSAGIVNAADSDALIGHVDWKGASQLKHRETLRKFRNLARKALRRRKQELSIKQNDLFEKRENTKYIINNAFLISTAALTCIICAQKLFPF